MHCRISIPAFALIAGMMLTPGLSLAETSDSAKYKVLSAEKGGLNISSIRALLKAGDSAASKSDLALARKHYDNARTLAKKLLGFYRGLSGSFRGLDARIPREMDQKGRDSLKVLAEANMRLAALFRRQKQPEVAVPLLVEVVQLMTPTKPLGRKAYQNLVELGFAETPYAYLK